MMTTAVIVIIDTDRDPASPNAIGDNGEPFGVVQAVEVNLHSSSRKAKAKDDAQQDGDIEHIKPLAKRDQRDKQQHGEGDAQINRITIVRIAFAANPPSRPDLHNAQTDKGDHHAGDQREIVASAVR